VTTVLETQRLVLRRLVPQDAEFMLALLTDPAWIRFIGDRGVRSVEGARDYLANGPIAMYVLQGFGLYLVELKDGAQPLGICGLIKRAGLDDPDLGFAFMPQFRGQGYAVESAQAVLDYARKVLGMQRVVAITSPDNDDSIKLLQRIGFRFERMVRLADGDEEVRLFAA
jgi:RimJ/RimL family protein N-acetyltransferase